MIPTVRVGAVHAAYRDYSTLSNVDRGFKIAIAPSFLPVQSSNVRLQVFCEGRQAMRILRTMQVLALVAVCRMRNIVAMAVIGLAGLACTTSELAAPELKVSVFAAPESGSVSKSALEKWGATSNPDGDCRFFLSDGMLLIHVPGGPRPHDLSPELNVINAPRVLRNVNGDFIAQVKVEGRFAPGSESMLPGRTPYNGAGLVVMFDENNFVTLVRAALQRGARVWPYANFELRKDAKLERFGEETETPIPLDGPLYLRLERRGMRVLGAFSIDGLNWNELAPKNLPDNWSATQQVGVVAISTSQEEFNPRFAGLRLDDL